MNLIVIDVLGQFSFISGEGWEMWIDWSTSWQHRVENVNKTVGIAGDGMSRNPNAVGFCVDPPNLAAPKLSPSVAHMTGHFFTGPNAMFDATTD